MESETEDAVDIDDIGVVNKSDEDDEEQQRE